MTPALAVLLSALAAGDDGLSAPDGGALPPAASVAPVPPAPPPPRQEPVVFRPPVFEHRNTWDLGLEGGVGTRFPLWNVMGLVRARAGALWIRNSFYWSLGVTFDWSSNPSLFAVGVQGELMHLETGLWVQVTPLQFDFNGKGAAMLAVGYSLFGVEAQVREYNGAVGLGVFVKLRLPLRLLLKALGV